MVDGQAKGRRRGGSVGEPVEELAFARLVRFYRIDPERILTLPTRLITMLQRQMPRLEAEALHQEIVAVTTPYLKPVSRRRLIGRLEQAMQVRRPKQVIVPTTHDPVAAKQWFESQGIATV